MFWAMRHKLLLAVGLGLTCALGVSDPPGSNVNPRQTAPSSPELTAIHQAAEAGDDFAIEIPKLETLSPQEMGPELGEFGAPETASETHEAAETLIKHFQTAGDEEKISYRDQTLAMIIRAEVHPPQKIRWLYEHLRRAHSQGENVPLVHLIRVDPSVEAKPHRKKYRTVRLIEATEQMLLKLDSENPGLRKLGYPQEQLRREVRHSILQIFCSISEYFGTKLTNLTRGTGYRLGVQRGLPLAMYKNETTGYRRPLSQKAQEVLVNGSILALFTGVVTYYSNAGHVGLYPGYAALQAGLFQFFWSYFERANSALRTYGMSYRHDLKGFDVNSKMYYLTQFFLSLPSALTIKWALHGGIEWNASVHAMENALIGTFARRWISVYIGRHQNSGASHLHSDSSRRHSFHKTFFLNLGSNMFITWIRNSHLAGWDNWISLGSIYVLMAAGDILWELKKHYTARLDMPRIRELSDPSARQRFQEAMKEIWKRFSKKDLGTVAEAFHLKHPRVCSTELYLLASDKFRAIQQTARGGR